MEQILQGIVHVVYRDIRAVIIWHGMRGTHESLVITLLGGVWNWGRSKVWGIQG